MNLTNVTRRRLRKSLLGTHQMKRESKLPTLSDTLYNIHEEQKEPNDDVLSIDEEVPIEQVQGNPDSLPVIFDEEVTTKNVPIALENPPRCEELRDIPLNRNLGPSRKRLDSFFSPKSVSNDDSFVIHETMLANDGSVLATSFDHVFQDMDTISESDDVIAVYVGEIAEESLLLNDETCYLVDRILKYIDRHIQEKNEFSRVCNQKIRELLEKVDNLTAEIEDIKTIEECFLVELRYEPASEKNHGKDASRLLKENPSFREMSKKQSDILKSTG